MNAFAYALSTFVALMAMQAVLHVPMLHRHRQRAG
jgi:hypothetical protein